LKSGIVMPPALLFCSGLLWLFGVLYTSIWILGLIFLVLWRMTLGFCWGLHWIYRLLLVA
jgi:hypothetical protein